MINTQNPSGTPRAHVVTSLAPASSWLHLSLENRHLSPVSPRDRIPELSAWSSPIGIWLGLEIKEHKTVNCLIWQYDLIGPNHPLAHLNNKSQFGEVDRARKLRHYQWQVYPISYSAAIEWMTEAIAGHVRSTSWTMAARMAEPERPWGGT